MNIQSDEIKEIITDYLEPVARELEEFDHLRRKQGKVTAGSWSNAENFMAYVSYFPQANPSE